MKKVLAQMLSSLRFLHFASSSDVYFAFEPTIPEAKAGGYENYLHQFSFPTLYLLCLLFSSAFQGFLDFVFALQPFCCY